MLARAADEVSPLPAPEAGGEPERGPPARLALDADRAAHRLAEALGDRKPEAGAAVSPRRRGIGL